MPKDIIRIESNVDASNDMIEFSRDIMTGLTKPHKCIQSKYFYDDQGCDLFDMITRHPDYYLTNCEIEILLNSKHQLADIVNNIAFNLIELGPGEGIKTQILVEEFLQDSLRFSYTPIDISAKYLNKVVDRMQERVPDLEIHAINSDYFNGIQELANHSLNKNIVLFLGSSIGNMNPMETSLFLRQLKASLHKGDYVLIGFDLFKDVNILHRAYDDSHGITRRFNMNLLMRMNRELGADFILDQFQHYAAYDADAGAMQSYLVSQLKQDVHFDSLKHTFTFNKNERIHVESSYKYLLPQIETLARTNQFEVVRHFLDNRKYFVDSLWQVL